ncbi:hypothetical protein [Streptococcus moroccensis]
MQSTFIRNITVGINGFDISYCSDVKFAMTFSSYAVANHIANCLQSYGSFHPMDRGY